MGAEGRGVEARRARAPGGLGVALLSALTLGACGPSGPEDWPEGRPRIDELRYLGQSPRDPFGLGFGLHFFDSDGDVGRGELFVILNGQEGPPFELASFFERQSPPVPLDAIEGDFEILVRLDSAAIQPNRELTIAFRLEDPECRKSNEPSITLRAGGGAP